MTPKRILLTGASGFVGVHLLRALRTAFPESDITGTSSCPTFGLHILDLTDAVQVNALVAEIRPDVCIHLAAIAAVAVARNDPERAWRVNLHGTLSLAGAIKNAAPACLFLFVSSADVYGLTFQTGRALDENALLAPVNVYGATKAAADLALGALAGEGLKVVRLRPFNHIGPGQKNDFAIPAFARQIALIEAGLQLPILRVGALDPYRDFLDVRDVVSAYVSCLRCAETIPNGAILNIASGTKRRIGDALEDLLRMAGVQASVETIPSQLRPTDIPTALGDAARAYDLIGWKPKIPWDRTLTDVLDDWRQRVRA